MFVFLRFKNDSDFKEKFVEVNDDLTKEEIENLFIDTLGQNYNKDNCYYEIFK